MPRGREWAPERDAELRHRWNSGQKRGVIRRAMGITSGQLAGKAMRLNLHNRGMAPPHDIASGSFEDVAARTRFSHAVREVADGSTLLKSGRDARKIGATITKGAWRGFPVYTLTLEERATCPRSCAQWIGCYGNQMNFARRWRHGDGLEGKLWGEFGGLQRKHPSGFVVRAHILGDWYSVGYLDLWHEALCHFPALHVFGYSAWPHHTKIGRAVKNLRDMQWDRFAVRTSGAPSGPRTVVIERAEDNPEGAIICPAQIETLAKAGKRISCGSCGLCWSPAAREKTIAFLRH